MHLSIISNLFLPPDTFGRNSTICLVFPFAALNASGVANLLTNIQPHRLLLESQSAGVGTSEPGQNHMIIRLLSNTFYEGCSEIIETPAVNKLLKKLKNIFSVVMWQCIFTYGLQVFRCLRQIFQTWDTRELRKLLVSGALQRRMRNVMAMKFKKENSTRYMHHFKSD